MTRPNPLALTPWALVQIAQALGVSLCLLTTISVTLAASKLAGPCGEIDVRTDKFLQCVVREIEAVERRAGQHPAITEPIKSYLVELSKALGYPGARSDLDKLKRISIELKRNLTSNSAAIAILDSAISAHVSEFRSILSARTLPVDVPAGENVFSVYLNRKLDYFLSSAPQFYDNGPYDILVRAQASNTFEEAYFLGRSEKRADDKNLILAQRYSREAIAHLSSPTHAFLPARQRTTLINDSAFYYAILLFALGDKPPLVTTLRDIVLRNQRFDLGTANIDHIYLHKVYGFPYQVTLLPGVDKDGLRNIEINDPALLRRMFNPAQLALFACSMVDDAGPGGIDRFKEAIGELTLSDYYVVVASANERAPLEELSKQIMNLLDSNRLQKSKQELTGTLGRLETKGFSAAISSGAKSCNIQDLVRNSVFAPFEFKSQIQEIQDFGRFQFHLLFGGRLNFVQARALSEFVNSSLLETMELQPLRKERGLTNKAYVARMRVDG